VNWDPLLLSIEVAVYATLIAGVVGIGLGALLASRRTPGRDLWDAILTAPMVMPPTVLGYYLLIAVGRKSALGGLWFDVFGKHLTFTFTGVVVAACIGALPMVVKGARTAFENVDPTLVAAARTLGASPTRAFFTVALPLAGPGIIAGLMLGFARGLGDFGVTLMIAGDIPGETQTAPLKIYDDVQAGSDRSAVIMSLVLTLGAVTTLYVVNRLTRRPHG
jgi:molybdate transport system permease protein